VNPLVACQRALLIGITSLGCGNASGNTGGGSGSTGGGSPSQMNRKAALTPSGLDKSKLLTSLTDQERTQFCNAATTTLYSASSPETECELQGVVNLQLAQGKLTCEDIKNMCLMDFIDTEKLKCNEDMKMVTACTATVGDGEQCSLASATVHAGLLPKVTCASDAQTAKASVAKVYASYVFASTPECQRYQTCRVAF
jgi:hypothetical protein